MHPMGAAKRFGNILILAADRRLEVTEPTSQRAPHLGQPLGSEHHEGDHENEQQMSGLENVADHCLQSLAGLSMTPAEFSVEGVFVGPR